ncbi:M12 family metallo-peptidase [Alteromonas sp. a30]|uniref:M12 family metallo-peptidase n=1 Tax=Alteromonas sp. a30 TaxID=2730917 RepID=UPI00227EA022|nr:M12 family metallo-peptidase [Alteromonas sp. a30]MCY7296538.1 hypothetical protein [Alteromonas sp. a30]
MKATLCASAVALSCAAQAETIDVAVLYTTPAANATGSISTKINQYISHANRIYRNNGLNITLRNVASASASSSNLTPTESTLNALTNSSSIQNYRASNRADMVVLLGTAERLSNGTVCGIGWVGQGSNGSLSSQSRNLMYSISAVDCGATTFVHELGHNMGLGHSVRQGSRGGVYADGVGHGVDNSFSTIMAYPQAFGSASRLDYFSDPNFNGCNGQPCGVFGQSNSWKTLNAVRDDVSRFY